MRLRNDEGPFAVVLGTYFRDEARTVEEGDVGIVSPCFKESGTLILQEV